MYNSYGHFVGAFVLGRGLMVGLFVFVGCGLYLATCKLWHRDGAVFACVRLSKTHGEYHSG